MNYLTTILLIIAVGSIWAVIMSVASAYRASREARNTIFPVIREEAVFRQRWANLLAMLFSTLALLAMGGWWFTGRLTGSNQTELVATQANTPEVVAVLPQPVDTPIAPVPVAQPNTSEAAAVAPQPNTPEAAAALPLDTPTAAVIVSTELPPTEIPPLPTDTPLPPPTDTPAPTVTETPLPATPTLTSTSVVVRVSTSIPSPTPIASTSNPLTTAGAAAIVTDPEVLAMLNVTTVTSRVALVSAVTTTNVVLVKQTPSVVMSSSVVAQPKFGPLIFTTTPDSTIKNSQHLFPSNTERIYAMFPYSDMQDGYSFKVIWSYQGKVLWSDEKPWQLGPAASSFTFINNFGSGVYVVELYVNNLRVLTDNFEIQ